MNYRRCIYFPSGTIQYNNFLCEIHIWQGGTLYSCLFLFYQYRKLRMSNFQNLASPKSEFYYVKGKRRLRTNKNEKGYRSPLDISKQVQLSKHELSNMRRSQVWTKIPLIFSYLLLTYWTAIYFLDDVQPKMWHT